MVIIKWALFGISTSGAGWYRHLSMTLRHIRFAPTRFDRVVWINLAKYGDHYDYIYTYVDHFMITYKAPEDVMELIKKEYHIKGKGSPDYYLGNDSKTYKGRYAVGYKKYIKEAIRRVQDKKKDKIKQQSVPASPGDHPKLDTSEFVDDDGHL